MHLFALKLFDRRCTNGFLQHLNSLRDTIKFTMEIEENCSLPFLDILVIRLGNGELDVSVYRKPTHTDRYLNYSSHHPEHVKRRVVKCLFDRA